MVVVTTADALAAAVSSGARDIEIRSHLDLTSLRRTQSPGEREPLDLFTDYNTHLMFVSNTTRSIRVRACGEAKLLQDTAELMSRDRGPLIMAHAQRSPELPVSMVNLAHAAVADVMRLLYQ